MTKLQTTLGWRHFIVGIISPAVLAIGLFVVAIFAVVIPALERAMMERKREMIRELTASAWSLLAEIEQQEKDGELSRSEAQRTALLRVKGLRYGQEGKDYFWITDMSPRMIMHPYREELNGQDLSGYKDPAGKRLFVEFVEQVKAEGEGYVSYMWQWKDDSHRIAPKLSYVKGFAPWGWIVGTGVYTEDVRAEIERVSRHVATVALIIILATAALLAYQSRQGWLLETRRRKAEEELRESEAKYRALVEAATEGVLMVLAGERVYSNPTLHSMLGYEAVEFAGLDLRSLFNTGDPGLALMTAVLENRNPPPHCETRLRTKSGSWLPVLLTTAPIALSGREGVIVTVKDIRVHKEVAAALGSTRDKFRALTESINVGIFRADLGRGGSFVELNPAAGRLLGVGGASDSQRNDLSAIFIDAGDLKTFLRQLQEEGVVKNKLVRLAQPPQGIRFLTLTASLIKEEGGTGPFCDGIVSDVTDQQRLAEERERLLMESQSSLLLLNCPLEQCGRPLVTCEHDWPAHKAAALMARRASSAVLVLTSTGETLGIVTDQDLRARLLAEGREAQTPVREIMSAPVVSLPGSALLFEACVLMQEKDIGHLVISGPDGKCVGLLESRDLLRIQRHSSSLLIKEIMAARNPEEVAEAHARVPQVARLMIEAGAEASNVTRILAAVSDAVTTRCIQLALDELGPPPGPFAFMALGSAAREEQTFYTDQDNAIVFDGTASGAEAALYFLKLGDRVCKWQEQAGYPLCNGGVMALNRKWCQPLPELQELFSSWTVELKDQDLRDVNICFDFRCVYGEAQLVHALRKHVLETVKDKPRFLFHLAESTLQFKPPVGFFGNIQVEGSGEHAESFNIKSAVVPIVNFARIYALHHGVTPANTLERLRCLRDAGVLSKTTCDEVVQAFNELMRMRLKHQAAMLAEGVTPDNYINPKKLTHLERMLLKRIFSHIAVLQSRLTTDFARTV